MRKLLVAGVLLIALAIVVSAKASTRQDAVKAQWYLRGYADAITPNYGLSVVKLTCRPTKTKFVSCFQQVTDGTKYQCVKGSFYVKADGLGGHWGKVYNCTKPTA